VSVVHQAVQDSVRQGVVADAGVPLIRRQLADDHRAVAAIAVVHDLHQIVAMRRFKGLMAPVVQDQQLHPRQLLEQLLVAAVCL